MMFGIFRNPAKVVEIKPSAAEQLRAKSSTSTWTVDQEVENIIKECDRASSIGLRNKIITSYLPSDSREKVIERLRQEEFQVEIETTRCSACHAEGSLTTGSSAIQIKVSW
jgi:hypothetical protein